MLTDWYVHLIYLGFPESPGLAKWLRGAYYCNSAARETTFESIADIRNKKYKKESRANQLALVLESRGEDVYLRIEESGHKS